MFQSKKPKSLRGVRHACKFRLRADASRDMRCSRALNTQLPRVIAECAIHHVIVMDGRSFGQSQWNLLFRMSYIQGYLMFSIYVLGNQRI